MQLGLYTPTGIQLACEPRFATVIQLGRKRVAVWTFVFYNYHINSILSEPYESGGMLGISINI